MKPSEVTSQAELRDGDPALSNEAELRERDPALTTQACAGGPAVRS